MQARDSHSPRFPSDLGDSELASNPIIAQVLIKHAKCEVLREGTCHLFLLTPNPKTNADKNLRFLFR